MSRRSKIAGESHPYDMTCCAIAHKAFPRPTLLPFGDSSYNPLYGGQKPSYVVSQQSYSRLLGNSPPFVVGLPTVSYHMTPSEPLNDLYLIPSGLRLCTGLSVLPLLTSHHVLELRWRPIHSTASAGWTYSFKERVLTSFYVKPKQKGHHSVASFVKLATEWCPFSILKPWMFKVSLVW